MFKRVLIILIAGIFIFGMNKLSFAMMCGDHSGSQQPAQAHSGHEQGSTVAIEEKASEVSVNVGNKVCPVSGEKVGQDGMEPVTYEYEGKVYNFCCATCVDDFKKDPEKYIKKIEEEKLQGKSKQEDPSSESHLHSD